MYYVVHDCYIHHIYAVSLIFVYLSPELMKSRWITLLRTDVVHLHSIFFFFFFTRLHLGRQTMEQTVIARPSDYGTDCHSTAVRLWNRLS